MDCDLLYDHIAAQMKNEIPQDLDQEIKDRISHWDVWFDKVYAKP
jgi:hypothetical protein